MKTRHGQTGHVRLGKATGIGGGFLRRRRLWLAVVVSVALLVGLAVVRHFQFRLTARLSHLGKVQADSQAHAQIQAQREAQIEANRIHQEQIRLDNLRNNNINAELSTDDSDSDSNDDNDETVNKPKSPVKLSVPSNILASRFNVPPIPTNSTDNLPSIAYAFLVHSQDSIDSLHESLSLLYHKNDVFIIHLDKKSPQSVFDNLRASYSAFKNIRVIDRQISHESAWASMNLLRAELSLLKSALSFSVDWSLFVLLDGAAFPLQTPLFIKRTLKPVAFSNSAVLFGAFQSLPRHMEFCFSDRESQSSGSCTSHAWRGARRKSWKTPNNSPVYKGSQWVVLSRSAAEYVIQDHIATPWLRFFDGSFAPDELFFQSILANKKNQHLNEDLKFVFKIHSDKGCSSYKPARARGFGPCTLGGNDWNDISEAQKNGFLFARKFYANDPVKDQIVEQVYYL